MKKKSSKWLTYIYLGVFLVSIFGLGKYFYTYYEASKTLTESQVIYAQSLDDTEQAEQSVVEHSENFVVRPQFHDLLQVNENIVGWISVDGTKLNNPVLQAADNEFYLDKNFKDGFSRAGSVFMDYRNDIEGENRNTILYGHAMKNGTMFGNLKEYLNQDYAEANRTVYFDSLYEGYDIEVFAAYETTIEFYYIETDFATDEHFEQYLEEVQEKSVIDMNVEVTAEDDIVTLSTCNNVPTTKDKRFVVQGKLVKRS